MSSKTELDKDEKEVEQLYEEMMPSIEAIFNKYKMLASKRRMNELIAMGLMEEKKKSNRKI